MSAWKTGWSCPVERWSRTGSVLNGEGWRALRTWAFLHLLLACATGYAQDLEADSVDRLLDRSFKEREQRPEQALTWARRALVWAEAHKDSVRMADALRKIALAGHERLGTKDSSFIIMERAMGISAAVGDSKGEQSAAKSLGKWFAERGEYARAMEHAERSLRVATKADDKKGICSALVTKGGIQQDLGDMEAAVTSFHRALELANELGDAARIGNLLDDIGNCYYELGRMEQAEEYYQRQLVHAKAMGGAGVLAEARQNLALIAADRGELERALQLVDSALVLMVEGGVPDEDRLVALNQKGHYLLELGRLDEASAVLNTSLGGSIAWGREVDRSYVLSDLGFLEMEQGRLVRCDSLFQAALRSAGDNLEARMTVLRHLATLREKQGRWAEAQELLTSYIAARDSFINEKATDQLARAEMRQKYKAHEQEMEISDLGARIAQERKLRNLVLGITALAIMLAVLAWRNWRAQRKLRLQDEALHGHEVARLMKQQEIRALDAVMRGQESERSRIAKDLHDRVGMLLSAVKMRFGALEGRIEKMQEATGAEYQRVTELLDTAVGEVRRISHDMEHGNLAAFGLAKALEDLRDAVLVPGKLEVELDTFGLADRLDRRTEIAAYRIVQEAVSNALRHARASHLSIQVTRSEALLNILVEDDGAGFDPERAQEGMGMSNLRSRAAELNGTVSIDSQPGRGTTVVVDLPVPPVGR